MGIIRVSVVASRLKLAAECSGTKICVSFITWQTMKYLQHYDPDVY